MARLFILKFEQRASHRVPQFKHYTFEMDDCKRLWRCTHFRSSSKLMEGWLANPQLLEPDAEYAEIIEINLNEIKEPILACPNDPDDVKLLSEVSGVEINEVFIGSCMTNIGHYRAAAKILENQGAVPVRMWVTPQWH